MTDVRSIGDDLRAMIVAMRASSRSSAQELRDLSKALRKREAELDELNLKLNAALSALPTEAIQVPHLDNKKKALTLVEIDRIADLERQGYSTDWIASQANCTARYVRMVIQISDFSASIRAAIDADIIAANFALGLVHKNGEPITSDFLREVNHWRQNGGQKLYEGKSLLSKRNIGDYAREIGLKPLIVG